MKKLRELLKNKKTASLIAISLTVVFTALLYLRIGRDPLFDWDEGIYGVLGQEMLENGRIFTPTWNGEVWFEKPPGIAWTAAIGMGVAGITPLGARLLMPLFAGLTLLAVYKIGERLKDTYTGFIAMLLLANMQLFLSRARGVNTDGPLLAGITLTAYAVLSGASPLVVAIIIALSVWFKGIAGLLPLLIALPLFIKVSKKYFLKVVGYVSAILAPWHLFAFFKYGDLFTNPYLKEQVVRRITTPIEFHLESKWFYFTYLYENLGASLILFAILEIAVLTYIFFKKKKVEDDSFLAWWVLLPLALFTLSKTRLFWYILPVYPGIALLVAGLLRRVSRGVRSEIIMSLFILFYSVSTVGSITRSVEVNKDTAPLSDRLQVVSGLKGDDRELAILVPETERVAEAVLPKDQRISSSFRYGGMPSVVFYYEGKVHFFYNVDEFNSEMEGGGMAMINKNDLGKLTFPYEIGIQGEDYISLEAK